MSTIVKKQNFQVRMEIVPISGDNIGILFGAGRVSDMEIEIQQMSLDAIMKARNASRIQEVKAGLLANLSSGMPKEQTDAVAALLGFSDKLSDETKNVLAFCEAGIVNPKMDYSQLLSISRYFPMQIIEIYHRIMRLNGLGALFVGELKAPTDGQT